MPRMTLRQVLMYVIPLLAAVGPLLALAASSYLNHREDLQRENRLARALARPEAVVEAAEHDFGVMDPLSESSHVFVIRNRGGGPLELSLGEPSSTSIRGEILTPVVPAGQSGEVRLTWTTGANQREYLQGVFVETNDRRNYQSRLMVGGTVRVQIAVEPQRLSVPDVNPGQTASVSTLLYSQVWQDLPAPRATCSIAGATCRVTAADPESLAAIQAKAGYDITVTLPADMPSGPFQGEVRIETQSATQGTLDPTALILPLSGRVLRRLAVYGAGVEEPGIVDLGIHPPGELRQRRLVLKVRDEEPHLKLVRAEFRPDFLQATLAPAGTDGKDHLYHLDITIPADAPECIYRSVTLGEMKLLFDHPRIPELSLPLTLAVMPRR